MSRVLLCASPIYGHVAPMITIGRHLVSSGHQVSILTGSRFADAVRAAGMEAISLPAACDYGADIYATFSAGATLNGLAKLRFDIENIFIGVMSDQYKAVRLSIAGEPVDVVIAEPAFTGIIPLLLDIGRPRPPVFVCGLLPLTVSSRDTAPFGLGLAPSKSLLGRIRNTALNFLVSKVIFGRAHRLAERQLRTLGVASLPCFVLDAMSLADDYLQLTCTGFEYPRSDLRRCVRFVGPILPAGNDFDPPDWWSELDGDRPVVLVTQGTLANRELNDLIGPTIDALADKEVLLVVTTGDEDAADALRAVAPANVYVEAFVPYHALMARLDVMITNGGYGGVHFALAHGVPLIVAAETEEKPEIAARVAWSGAGINLRTGTPTSVAIGAAVESVINDDSYRGAARSLGTEMSRCSPLSTIEAAVAAASDRWPLDVPDRDDELQRLTGGPSGARTQ